MLIYWKVKTFIDFPLKPLCIEGFPFSKVAPVVHILPAVSSISTERARHILLATTMVLSVWDLLIMFNPLC